MLRVIVISSIFALLDVYLSWSLRLPLVGILALTAAFLVIVWMPLVFWQSESVHTTRFEIVMQWIAFTSVGFMSFLWIGTTVRDLISIFVSSSLHTPQMRAYVFVFAIVAFALGAFDAIFRLKIIEKKIRIQNLPPALEGFRIVQITDLHVGPTIRHRQVARMIRKINEARPDILVLTGDAIDGSVQELSHILVPFGALSPPFGKYYVPGNHEYYWGGEAWITHFHQLGFVTLLNSHSIIHKEGAELLIAGVIDPASKMFGGTGPDLKQAVLNAPSSAYPRVLLAHQPGISALAEAAGFQLQISGHTHGGQFFPWTLVVGWVHQFPHGLGKLKEMWVYVSRGTGFWGPPVRLGAPAEVSVMILTSN